jgi:oligopeptidase B
MNKATILPAPPRAEQRPFSYERHGVTIDDPWAWLRDQDYPDVQDPDVLAYLKAENAYFEAAMKPHKALTEQLFEEMKGRIKEDDASVPLKDGDWLYWTEFKTGTQYRLWHRKPVLSGAEGPASGGEPQLLLDENAEAEGHEYFRLGAVAFSNDGRIMAYSSDTSGDERYTIRFRDIGRGEVLDDQIEEARAPWGEDGIEGSIGQLVFSADDSHLFYGIVDEFWRCRTIRRHKLGSPAASDETVYFEEDETFSVGAGRSTDHQWIVITSGNNSTNESYLIPASDPTAAPALVKHRKTDVQYEVDGAHGKLWILTNDSHVNFRIVTADPANPGKWEELIPGSDRTYLRGLTSHRDHMLITSRVDGLDQLLLRDYSIGEQERVPFDEASYSANFAGNPEYAPESYRLAYSSMVTPQTVYDYHPAEKWLEVRKVQEIPSGYDASQYVTERLMIPARDGKQVPVSVLRRKDSKKDCSG